MGAAFEAMARGKPINLPREEIFRHLTKDDEMHSEEYRQDELHSRFYDSDAETETKSDQDVKLPHRGKRHDA